MTNEAALSELKEAAKGLSLLYVEDNEGLRSKMHRLMERFFTNVISVEDGERGIEAFKTHRPQIVITGINIPKVNGFSLIKQIKKVEPSTKFIVLSATEDKELLHQAISVGIFEYLTKPVKVDLLLQVLIRCIATINMEENGALFNSYMSDMLNYQSDLLAMVSDGELLFINQMFLDFFDVDDLDDFYQKHKDFGSLLRQHKGFLYNDDNGNWFDKSSAEVGKLYHTKIMDLKHDNRHFILKLHPVPQKRKVYIMSLNDITELNLLALFDSKAIKEDESNKNRSALLNLMKVVQKNSAEIKIHNFYKGLTITNIGVVQEATEKSIMVKTSFIQQKATKLQKNMLISSEIFPSAILCEPILKIDFEQQTIVFKEMRFYQEILHSVSL